MAVRRGPARNPSRSFCACQTCGSRWIVSEEVDVGERKTLYAWEEADWDEDDLALEQAKAEEELQTFRELKKRHTEQHARRSAARADEALRAARAADDERVERLESGESGCFWWRWRKSENCRIDASGVTVWSGDSGSATCTLERFLANNRWSRRFRRQHLPPSIQREAMDAARTLQNTTRGPTTRSS